MRSLKAFIFAAFAGAAVFASCTAYSFTKVDAAAGEGAFAEAARKLDTDKKKIYGDNSLVLHGLDAGLLYHYAGEWKASSERLEEAERLIEDAYTKSLTETLGSLLANDTVLTYSGEDYENFYANAFNALNYYHLGKTEDSLVEIRRMNGKIQTLSARYADMSDKLRKEAEENNAQYAEKNAAKLSKNDFTGEKFTNSALGRYLSLLFYRGKGQLDEALIDKKALLDAYKERPDIYDFPPPSSIEGEFTTGKSSARLNFLIFSGKGPVKNEVFIQWDTGRYAIPVLAQRPQSASRVKIVFDRGLEVEAELLENLANVARAAFDYKKDYIYLKTAIRAAVKYISADVLYMTGDSLARDGDSAELAAAGLILQLAGIAARAGAAASEHADLRLSRYFPARAWCAALDLPPGAYNFRVNFYDAQGRLLESTGPAEAQVKSGQLNLVEAVYMR